MTSYIFLKLVSLLTGLRVPLEEEYLGADIVEHGIGNAFYDKHAKKLIMFDADDDDERFKDIDHASNAIVGRARRHSHTFGLHPGERFPSLGSQQTLVNRSSKKKKSFFDFRFRNRFKKRAKLKSNCIKSSFHYSDNDIAMTAQTNGGVYRIRESEVPSDFNFVFSNSPARTPHELRNRGWSGCDGGEICTVHCEDEYHSSETSENTHM